jgi:hypothetical protein
MHLRYRFYNNPRSGRPCIVGIYVCIKNLATKITSASQKNLAIGGGDKNCWAWCFADDPSSHRFNSPIGVDLDTPKFFSHAPPLITPPPRVLGGRWCVKMEGGISGPKMKIPSIFRKGARSAPYWRCYYLHYRTTVRISAGACGTPWERTPDAFPKPALPLPHPRPARCMFFYIGIGPFINISDPGYGPLPSYFGYRYNTL